MPKAKDSKRGGGNKGRLKGKSSTRADKRRRNRKRNEPSGKQLRNRLDDKFENQFGNKAASRHQQLSLLRRQRDNAKKKGNQRRARRLQDQIQFFKKQYSPASGPLQKIVNPESFEAPSVVVNEDGTLKLPFDPSFSLAMKNLLAESQDELLGLKVEEDQQNQQYTRQAHQLDKEYDTARHQTKNKSAASGTLFSSAYGTKLSDVASQYASDQSELDLANTQFRQQTAAQRAAIQGMLNRKLGDTSFGYVTDLSENAGALGYGGKLSRATRQAQTRKRQLQKRRSVAKRNRNQNQVKYYQQKLNHLNRLYRGID